MLPPVSVQDREWECQIKEEAMDGAEETTAGRTDAVNEYMKPTAVRYGDQCISNCVRKNNKLTTQITNAGRNPVREQSPPTGNSYGGSKNERASECEYSPIAVSLIAPDPSYKWYK